MRASALYLFFAVVVFSMSFMNSAKKAKDNQVTFREPVLLYITGGYLYISPKTGKVIYTPRVAGNNLRADKLIEMEAIGIHQRFIRRFRSWNDTNPFYLKINGFGKAGTTKDKNDPEVTFTEIPYQNDRVGYRSKKHPAMYLTFNSTIMRFEGHTRDDFASYKEFSSHTGFIQEDKQKLG